MGFRPRVLMRLRTMPGPYYGHVSKLPRAAHVVDARTVAFQVLDAGPHFMTTAMQPGSYDLEVQTPSWIGLGGFEFRAATSTPATYLFSTLRPTLRHFTRTLVMPALRGWFAPWWSPPGPAPVPQLTRIQQAGALRRLRVIEGGAGGDVSVEPLLDGVENFAAIVNLINSAEHFIYIVNAVLDEDMGVGSEGPARPPTFHRVLKQRAKDVWDASGRMLDTRILVFDPSVRFPVDPDGWLGSHFGKVRDVVAVRRQWQHVSQLDEAAFVAELRTASNRGEASQAPEALLKEFRTAYRASTVLQPQDWLPFPSGMQVMRQEHPDFLGCYHQKIVMTEKGMWIGGLNFQKQYWDALSHSMLDIRRASSGEGPSSPPAAPHVRPWHDVGALVRGSVLAESIALFAQRWDHAQSYEGPYAPLADQLVHRGVDPLIAALRAKENDIMDTRVTTPNPAYTTPADPAHTPDVAAFAVTLPRFVAYAPNGKVTQIYDLYRGAIGKMSKLGSFLYFENQYFTHFELAETILQRWRQNLAQLTEPLERPPPFAYVTLPYRGDPTFDYFEKTGAWISMPRLEMQILKWLEISTARKILEKDPQTGLWQYAWGVTAPERDIVPLQPRALGTQTRFEVRNAFEIDPVFGDPVVGGKVEDKQFTVGDVLTESDIMAFTLCARTRKATTQPNAPDEELRPATVGGSPTGRLHAFLLENHIYLHAKCATFANSRDDIFIATQGSANLNPRGLDDSDPDAEANMFWRGRDSVTVFHERLWEHHVGRTVGPVVFAAIAFENLTKIMSGGDPLEGRVVRLDVVERFRNA